jgi:hypothetical protein
VSFVNADDLRQGFPTVVGQFYAVSYGATGGGAASSFLNVGTSSGNNSLINGFLDGVTKIFKATTTTTWIRFKASGSFMLDNVSVKPVGPAILLDRSAAAGAYFRLGLNQDGTFVAIANDGTTTRTVTSPAAYNTATNVKARVEYATSGTLTLKVNGQPVASATGAPLLTLSNATAVTTVGNARSLDAAFPGSIALVKASATIPTLDQSALMYEQEKFLFAPGAACTLPDAANILDWDYDALLDRIKIVSASNESSWTGLNRTSAAAPSAGSFTKAAHRAGIKLLARSTTNPGVDVSIPSYGLREELFNRSKAAADRARLEEPFDYSGGFQCTTTLNSTALTNVVGWVYPPQVNPRGVPLVAAGIPAGAVVTDVVGSTVYISAPATATAANVSVTTTDQPLPTGYEARKVGKNGTGMQEGIGKGFTRVFDGFVERPRLVSNPVYSDWVQVSARRTA